MAQKVREETLMREEKPCVSTGVFEQRTASQITHWELGSPSAQPERTLPTAPFPPVSHWCGAGQQEKTGRG